MKKTAAFLFALLLIFGLTGCEFINQIFGIAPVTPTGLTVGSATVNGLQISWNTSKYATSYQLFRDTDMKGAFATKVYDNTGLYFTDSGLSSSTTYYYMIMATGSGGSSSRSSAQNGKTLAEVTSVSLDVTTVSIPAGGTQQLTATVLPSTARNKDVSWSTSDEKVATVTTKGLITAIAIGTATITATTADGGFAAACAVTVVTPTATLKVINNSTLYTVVFLYVSPSTSSTWGDDQLGANNTIAPFGGTFTLDGIPPGTYDLLAVDQTSGYWEADDKVLSAGQTLIWTLTDTGWSKIGLPSNRKARD